MHRLHGLFYYSLPLFLFRCTLFRLHFRSLHSFSCNLPPPFLYLHVVTLYKDPFGNAVEGFVVDDKPDEELYQVSFSSCSGRLIRKNSIVYIWSERVVRPRLFEDTLYSFPLIRIQFIVYGRPCECLLHSCSFVHSARSFLSGLVLSHAHVFLCGCYGITAQNHISMRYFNAIML